MSCRFKNNVYYVSVNQLDPVKLHFFSESKYSWGYDFASQHKSWREDGNYRSQADYKVWLSNLIKRETDYLFVYSLHQTKKIAFSIEESWAKTHNERFVLVFQNDTIQKQETDTSPSN